MKQYSALHATLLLLLISGGTVLASGQTLTPRHERGVSEYIIGPGDQVNIHVDDLTDIPDRPMRINPDGFLDFPLIGRVQVAGLTIEQLREQLQAKLKKYITDPQISINLIDSQSRTVSVVGAVNSPGVRPITGPQTLIEAISMAGGLRPDAGSRVILTRQARWGELPLPQSKMDSSGSYSTATLSVQELFSSVNPSDNILVDPGDSISISTAEIVYVVGTVKKAGGFPLAANNSMSLLHTLSLAQGLDHNAAAGKARILRPSIGGDGPITEIPVDINKILSGKQPDVPLYANDVLYVPSSIAQSGAKRTAEAIIQVAMGVAIYRF